MSRRLGGGSGDGHGGNRVSSQRILLAATAAAKYII